MSAILLCFFLVLCTLVLALPLHLSLRVSRQTPTAAIAVEIRFGFYRALAAIALFVSGQQRLLHIALFNRQLPFPRLDLTISPTAAAKRAPASAQRKEEAAQPEDQDDPPDNERKRDILLLLRTLVRPLLKFFARFPRVFWLNELALQGRFGFADPAQTGSLYGLLEALRALPIKRTRLDLTPDFCTRGACGQLHLTLHIHLGFIIALGIRLLAHTILRYLAVRLRFFKPRYI